MPGDGDYSLSSLKRKLNSWLIGLTKDNTDSFNDSWQTKQIIPDTKDIVNLLRSTGFKTVDMKVEKTNSQSSLTSLVCRVTVKCAKSGMSVVLESEGECRCPEEAHADNASTWCVLSPSNNNKDSLNKSGSVAGSSLLPELPANVSELVGSATRCVLWLLEEPEGQTPSRGRFSLGGGSGGRCKAPLKRTSSAAAGDPGRLGAQLAHHRSLDDMQWEASVSPGSGVPPSRPVRTLSDAAISPLAALSHSRSDGQLAQAGTATATATATGVGVGATFGTDRQLAQAGTATGVGVGATFGTDSSGGAAADTASDTAADTSASMDVSARFVAPPRRQSTTLEDYNAFKKPLCNPVDIRVESTESLPSINHPAKQEEIKTGPKTNQENPAPLPPHKAKEVIKKAEGAIQNMSEVMEMLKKWMISEEGPSTEVPSAKARSSKARPTRLQTFSRTSIPATRSMSRRSAPAGVAGHAKQQAAASRSPSGSSPGSASSRASSASSSTRGTLSQGTAKAPKTPAAVSGPSKAIAKSAIACLRRRSLEDGGAAASTPGTPRAPVTRRLHGVASPYRATAPSFGFAARSPRPSPAPAPAPGQTPNPSPRPSPRARVPPPKPKRMSMD